MTAHKIVKSTEAEKDIIGDHIVEYNRAHAAFTQVEDFTSVNYHICDDGGKIIAGIIALMYCWKVIYIDVLFVLENHRNKGLGSTLLKHIEGIAKSEDAHLIHLDTFSWQSRDFYLKHDFEIFGILDDCPKGYKRYYMKKVL